LLSLSKTIVVRWCAVLTFFCDRDSFKLQKVHGRVVSCTSHTSCSFLLSCI